MADWFSGRHRTQTSAGTVNLAGPNGVVLTAGAVANTKGAWATLHPAVPFEVVGLHIIAQNGGSQSGATNTRSLIDIGIGEAGSETVVIPNILSSFQSYYTYATMGSMYVPIRIPKGSRISARAQCSFASQRIRVHVFVTASDFNIEGVYTVVNDYGTVLATTTGTYTTSLQNAKGAWYELVTTTTYPVRSVVVMTAQPEAAVRRWLIDIGMGAAGSERVVIPDIAKGSALTHRMTEPHWAGPFPVHIPAGVRLAARQQCDHVNSAYRPIDVSILGFS
jgi:hypothetical protein